MSYYSPTIALGQNNMIIGGQNNAITAGANNYIIGSYSITAGANQIIGGLNYHNYSPTIVAGANQIIGGLNYHNYSPTIVAGANQTIGNYSYIIVPNCLCQSIGYQLDSHIGCTLKCDRCAVIGRYLSNQADKKTLIELDHTGTCSQYEDLQRDLLDEGGDMKIKVRQRILGHDCQFHSQLGHDGLATSCIIAYMED